MAPLKRSSKRSGCGYALPFSKNVQGGFAAVATGLGIGVERGTDGRTLRVAEYPAEVVLVQLDAAHTCRLALWHARDRR
ncbi:hypothetical protein D3C81_1044820 [compost metagenome]